MRYVNRARCYSQSVVIEAANCDVNYEEFISHSNLSRVINYISMVGSASKKKTSVGFHIGGNRTGWKGGGGGWGNWMERWES